MSTSDFRCFEAGLSGPFEACTADIESSTVTRCSRPPVLSFSERPSAGRISASRPVTTCERLSFVDTWTVRSARRMAASVTAVSETAETKLPPIAKKTLTLPSRSAWTASTVSRPCSRGGSKPNSSRSASRKCSGARSQMPIVRSPCTLEWPRTGHRPAPGLPMLPCSSATLTNSLIVATELRCWVMPIAQQKTVAEESRSMPAASSISGAVETGGPLDLGPVEARQVVGVLGEAVGVPLDEVAVDRSPLQQQGTERLEQRQVAVDAHRAGGGRRGRCRRSGRAATGGS